ncbi:MAG: dihydrofolate reductase, partial [Puniceicoccales bacterium]|nr:dihydrofolate reductase [Puniceicoccales bacterium]
IGADGKIPWHIPEELRLFRSLTMGHTVIVGRKTFQSIGKPLPGRNNWVLSRREPSPRWIVDPTTVRFFFSAEEVLAAVRGAEVGKEFWVIGGTEIYRLFLPHCSEVIQTVVPKDCVGDAHFSMPEDFVRGELLVATKDFMTHRWTREKRMEQTVGIL